MGLLDTQRIYNLIGKLNYTKNKFDDFISRQSTNAVQNATIAEALDTKISNTGGTINGRLDITGEEGELHSPNLYMDSNGLISGVNNIQFTSLGLSEDCGIDMANRTIKNVATPKNSKDAVNKQYADNIAGNALPLAGGTMSGNINMGGCSISNLPYKPAEDSSAVNVGWVKENIVNYSEEEHIIGTWVDGKSLVYEKTIEVATPNNPIPFNSEKMVRLGITDIQHIINSFGFVKTVGSSFPAWFSIDFNPYSRADAGLSYYFGSDNEGLILQMAISDYPQGTQISDCYITVQYIKS